MGLRRLFYALLPQRGLSRFGGWVARRRAGALTTAYIRWFVRHYGVVPEEAGNLDSYRSFREFFIRALPPGARPLPADAEVVASPVDGVVTACGPIEHDGLIQAKGSSYSLEALLADKAMAERCRGGSFITVYLCPRDYHRVHAPLAGDLRQLRHVPGRLWPARPWAVREISGLYTRNERAIFAFESPIGFFALVMVGALFVGGIETVATGPIRSGRLEPRLWNFEPAPRHFERGEEIGRFNFGSTVIGIFPAGSIRLDASVLPGTEIRLGASIGRRTIP